MSEKLSEFLAEHKASEFGLAPVSKALAIKMAKALEQRVANSDLANEEARKTIDRLSALAPGEANDSASQEEVGELATSLTQTRR